jgi:hypothetical protein
MRLGFIAGTTGLCIVGVALVSATERPLESDLPDWVADSIGAALAPNAGGDVLVFVVGSAERVREVRASVRSERMVAATESALAIEPGRIVAANLDAAEVILVEAGWIDRKFEILTAPSMRPAARQNDSPGVRSSATSDETALLSKRTLTSGEAMRALELLDGM